MIYQLSDLPHTVGEEVNLDKTDDIILATPQVLPAIAGRKSRIRYGTVGEGPDLARIAWSEAHHVFSLQRHDMRHDLPHRPKATELVFNKLSKDFLNRNPVEVLLIDEGDRVQPEYPIEKWVGEARPQNRPKVVLVFGSTKRMADNKAWKQRKATRKSLELEGYQGIEWCLNSRDLGGALDQDRLVDVYFQSELDGPVPKASQAGP